MPSIIKVSMQNFTYNIQSYFKIFISNYNCVWTSILSGSL